MNKLFDDYERGPVSKKITHSCFLCGSERNLTKEHVLPRWVFENNTSHSLTIDVNQLSLPYSKLTLPACENCNCNLLNTVEKYIQKTLSEVDLRTTYYSSQQWDNIIRWLELIDFKFQVLDISKKFLKHKNYEYVPFLAHFSVAFMRHMSIRSITSKARLALKRVTTKDRSRRSHALVVASMKEKTFHNFHTSGQFIYLEVPRYNKAFFYFYEREFKNDNATLREAKKIIREVYKERTKP